MSTPNQLQRLKDNVPTVGMQSNAGGASQSSIIVSSQKTNPIPQEAGGKHNSLMNTAGFTPLVRGSQLCVPFSCHTQWIFKDCQSQSMISVHVTPQHLSAVMSKNVKCHTQVCYHLVVLIRYPVSASMALLFFLTVILFRPFTINILVFLPHTLLSHPFELPRFLLTGLLLLRREGINTSEILSSVSILLSL